MLIFLYKYRSLTRQRATYIQIASTGFVTELLLMIIGIAICFWGLQFSRVVSSIAFAILLGYITYAYMYVASSSLIISIMSATVASIIGLVLGFVMFRFILSLTFSYMVASMITGSLPLMIVLVILLTVIIYVLSRYVIALVLTLVGITIVYRSLTTLGLAQTPAVVLAIAIGVIGLLNQIKGITLYNV